VGDSLTSFGGDILENIGQTTGLAFLEAGAAGSYGTIEEPCNYTQKFPDPVDYFYQTRGFSLAEAYYQSVLNPFEGLFVGEPLAAPFAHPGTAVWSSLTNGTVLAGTAMLSPDFTAAATNLPLAQADLFVDGTFFQTMTNLPPAGGNVLTVVLNGTTINYTVTANNTLSNNAAGLAGALNAQTGVTHVLAFPYGDRVELQSEDVYVPGSNVTVSASTAIGSAPVLTSGLTAARPVFLDTVATGYQVVTVYNAPMVGDWMQLMIVKTNGTMVTLGVTNMVSGTTVGTMALNLVNQINASPALQTADGLYAADFYDADPYEAAAQFTLYGRTAGWPAAQILATLNTSTNLVSTPGGTNPLEDNVSDLRPRNHLYVSSGTNTLNLNFACDTTQLSDGHHQFTAVAYEGTSVGTQTRVEREVQIQNTGLTATLAALPGQPFQFTVTANTTNLARIELFTTGGSAGVVTNQPAGVFTVSDAYLGPGLHPFYALVTDQSGHRYQTATAWFQIPNLNLTLAGTPPVLAWPAVAGFQYYLQSATNLMNGFSTVATITATNPVIQWPVTNTGNAGFYRVQLVP
jgi:hypothetical protein